MYYPPTYPLIVGNWDKTIFLAGSINNGETEDWQQEIGEFFEKQKFRVFNPRRKDWNKEQNVSEITDYLKTQINWELDHLHKCSHVLFYFRDDKLAPISLLELGLAFCNFHVSNIYVIIDPSYPRMANVITTCEFYGIDTYGNFEQFKGSQGQFL